MHPLYIKIAASELQTQPEIKQEVNEGEQR